MEEINYPVSESIPPTPSPLAEEKSSFWKKLPLNQKISFVVFLLLFAVVPLSLFVAFNPVKLQQKAQTAAEIQKEFLASADSYMAIYQPAASFGGDSSFKVAKTRSDVKKGILKFDLSEIPNNAIILDAKLTLNVIGWNGAKAAVNLYQILQPWEEKSVNWLNASASATWKVPGAGGNTDIILTSAASFEAGLGKNEINIRNLVNNWVASPAANQGILLSTLVDLTNFIVSSKESSSPPKLIVRYSLPLLPTTTPTNIPEPTATPVAAPIPPLPTNPECPGPTPWLTIPYGRVFLDNQPAPVNTRVWAVNPRGEIAGCWLVNTAGLYGAFFVYGEDFSAMPPIPGMRENEPITFYVNDLPATTSPALVLWQDDRAPHEVTLYANNIGPTATPTPEPTLTPTLIPTATSTPTPRAPIEKTITLFSIGDTYIKTYEPNGNFGSLTSFEVGLWGTSNRRSGLLLFDLSSIPQTATINTATLSLRVWSWANKQAPIAVYQILRPWSENQANWKQTKNGEYWEKEGAEGNTDRNWRTAAVFLGKLGDNQADLTGLVRNWVKGTSLNNGIILYSGDTSTSFSFSSREGSSKPSLTVTYTLP